MYHLVRHQGLPGEQFQTWICTGRLRRFTTRTHSQVVGNSESRRSCRHRGVAGASIHARPWADAYGSYYLLPVDLRKAGVRIGKVTSSPIAKD